MAIIIWLIVGGVCGWLASLIMRTDAQQGIILNVVVGIVGAVIAGLLFVSLGILTDILIKIYYAISAESYYSVREIIRNGVVTKAADLPKDVSERRSGCTSTDIR